MKINACSAQKQAKKKREKMYLQISELSTKVQAIEVTQKEMLKILRELKGDKGSSQAGNTTEHKTLEGDKGSSQTDNTTEHKALEGDNGSSQANNATEHKTLRGDKGSSQTDNTSECTEKSQP